MGELIADNLIKEYATPGEPLRILSGVTVHLNRGESLAIVGPSGSGKSTLLAIVGTLDFPTSGSLRLDGVDPFSLDADALARFRSRNVGFIFQDHYLLPQCTVLENVLVPLLADGGTTAAGRRYATELLDRVGLSSRLGHRPAELSGGEHQRVAIARALIHRPVLLLADEPTGNLDRSTAESVGRLLVDLQSERNSMLMVVTHSMFLAGSLQQRLELDAGRLQPAS